MKAIKRVIRRFGVQCVDAVRIFGAPAGLTFPGESEPIIRRSKQGESTVETTTHHVIIPTKDVTHSLAFLSTAPLETWLSWFYHETRARVSRNLRRYPNADPGDAVTLIFSGERATLESTWRAVQDGSLSVKDAAESFLSRSLRAVMMGEGYAMVGSSLRYDRTKGIGRMPKSLRGAYGDIPEGADKDDPTGAELNSFTERISFVDGDAEVRNPKDGGASTRAWDLIMDTDPAADPSNLRWLDGSWVMSLQPLLTPEQFTFAIALTEGHSGASAYRFVMGLGPDDRVYTRNHVWPMIGAIKSAMEKVGVDVPSADTTPDSVQSKIHEKGTMASRSLRSLPQNR